MASADYQLDKPPKLHNFLHHCSCHDFGLYWYLSNFAFICAREDDFVLAKRDFVFKLKKSSPRHPSLKAINDITFRSSHGSRHAPYIPGDRASLPITWIVLPFQFNLAKSGMTRSLYNLWHRLSPSVGGAKVPRVSWKLNKFRHVHRLISICHDDSKEVKVD